MQFAYKYFGKMSEYYFMKTFEDMKTDLRKAGINVTVSEYISVSLATSALVFAISTPLFAVISTLFVGNMEAITTGQAYILGLLMGLLGGVFSATMIFLFFHSYPSLIIGERKKKISDSLPFATLYLTTVAGSGTPPIAMFKALSSFSEYGEIAKESKRISEETEIMGVNFVDAVENAGIDCEMIDLRTLWPLDIDLIFNSVRKTGRVVIVEESPKQGGLGAEIGMQIAENIPDYLLAPITRIAAPNTPAPFAPEMEKFYIPQRERIVEIVEKLVKEN